MMSGAAIRELSRQAATKAASEHKVPFIVEREDLEDWKANGVRSFPFPFIGSYEPEGWERVKEYFVDSSGFGQDGEPALSMKLFLDKLVAGKGYAVTEAGQFQVYVGEYERA